MYSLYLQINNIGVFSPTVVILTL